MVDHQLSHELYPWGEIVREDDDQQVDNCIACGELLSGVTYRCRDCPAHLHEKCANLPIQILSHALHRNHTLELIMDPPPNYLGTCVCKFCWKMNKGNFAYRCVADCELILDINCATLPKFMVGSYPEQEHFSHEHPLVSIDNHFEYHDHLLTLSFKDAESDVNRMVCNICEENRNPEHWFYRCKDCEFTPSYFKAHTKCVLGKHSFIRMGMNTYRSDVHEHTLEIVKVYDYPECGRCKGSIEDDIALECREPDCNFKQHWKCPIEN